jgi:glycosyltransferase involved in cell wall biosynthesis
MKSNGVRGLILTEDVTPDAMEAVDSLLSAGLPVTVIRQGSLRQPNWGSQADVIAVSWTNNFSAALNEGLDSIKPGTWVFRMDTDEYPPEDLAERLLAAVSYAEERNTDAVVIPAVEWMDKSYQAICPTRLWRHTSARRYRGAVNETLYDQSRGQPLHRAFYPLAPHGMVLRHTPSSTRDHQRELRRGWLRSDPESRDRARAVDLLDKVVGQHPGWQILLRDFFSGAPDAVSSRMLHGGSLTLTLLTDYIFSSNQETCMRDSTVRLVQMCLGLFGWSPYVLFCALRLLAISDPEGDWTQRATTLQKDLHSSLPIFHSVNSQDSLTIIDDLVEIIGSDARDFQSLEYSRSLELAFAVRRRLDGWDRLDETVRESH